MSAFRGIFLSGSSRAALSIDRTQLPAGQTGALAQLASGLTPPLTFSRISGTGITVDASGVVSVSAAFSDGEARDLVARVESTSGDAAERRFVLQGAALPAPTSLRLITPSTRHFPDTAATGDVLATLAFMPTGATATATLESQVSNPVQPPADALLVVGNQLRAGPGWASVDWGVFRLLIAVTLSGQTKFTETKCMKYANGPADRTVTDQASWDSAMTAAAAATTGFVIEVDPNFEVQLPTIAIPLGTRNRMVVIRTSAPDRINGPHPKFNRVIFSACSKVFVQGCDVYSRTHPNGVGERHTKVGIPVILTGANRFVHFWRARAIGGQFSWTGSATVMDPLVQPDPSNMWELYQSYLRGTLISGTYTRIDLARGHVTPVNAATDPVNFPNYVQTGSTTLGEWTAATVPCFVGQGIPGGTPGVHANCVYGLGSDLGAPAGSGLNADIETAFLTSTPVATVNGGMQSKPDVPGAPDGIYIVAWRLNAGGTGYTNTDGRSNLMWDNQWTRNRLMAGFQSTGSDVQGTATLECACLFTGEGFRLPINGNQDPNWHFGNETDGILKDHMQIPQRGAAGLTPWTHATEIYFHHWGRTIGNQQGYQTPHSDLFQSFDNALTGDVNVTLRIVGCTGDNGSGGPGTGVGASQGLFLTDNFVNAGDAFNVVTAWNAIRCDASNGLVIVRMRQVVSWADYTNRNFGAGNPQNGFFIPGGSKVVGRSIAGGWRRETGGPILADYVLASSVTFAAPTSSPRRTRAEMAAAYKVTGALASYGPFRDAEQDCDHVAMVFDPDAIKQPIVTPTIVNAAPSALVISDARQLVVGRQAKAVSVPAGLEWAKGVSAAAAQAGPFTSAPGTLSPLEWIALRTAAPASPAQVKDIQGTVDGQPAAMKVLTADTASTGPTTDGAASIGGGTPAAQPTRQRMILAMSYFMPSTPAAFGLFSAGTNNWVEVFSNGTLRLQWGSASVVGCRFSNAIRWGEENRIILMLDLTIPSPIVDESGDAPVTINHAPGTIRGIFNGQELPVLSTDGQVSTVGGARNYDFIGGGSWRALGRNAVFAANTTRLGFLSMQIFAPGDPWPAMDTDAEVSLYSNANVAAGGANLPGVAPQGFFQGTAAQANSGGIPNTGTLGSVIPNMVKQGAGVLS